MRVLMWLVLLLMTTACSTIPPENPNDPYEEYNRDMFAFNDSLDRNILKPVARAYADYTPGFMQTGVSNFFSNLDDVWNAANNLLQGKVGHAFSDTGRFLINSTVGIFGLFDVASPLGLEKHDEDFGQTLAVWGWKDSHYFVMPFLGPSTLRDMGGTGVEYLYDPMDELFNLTDEQLYSLWALELVDFRASLLPAEDALGEVKYGRYEMIRDLYLQRRQFVIYDGNPPKPEEDDLLNELDMLDQL